MTTNKLYENGPEFVQSNPSIIVEVHTTSIKQFGFIL